MFAVPNIVLTECLPDSLTPSENPVRDLTYIAEENPTRDVTAHRMVSKPTVLREGLSEGLQQEPCFLGAAFKQGIALLLTELEMRVLSPHEAQELWSAGKVLQTLTISPQTKQISEAELSQRPVLMLFKKENTPRGAYKRLYSLLELSKPVPKPRMISSHQPIKQSPLMEALRRGIETGDGAVMFWHTDECKTQQSTLNSSSVDSVTNRRRTTQEARLSTYKRLDSLEETIRELENTLIEIGGRPTADDLYAETTITSQRTSEAKKPPVPPKPSIQVHFLLLLREHFFCFISLLCFFSASVCWDFPLQASDVCALIRLKIS